MNKIKDIRYTLGKQISAIREKKGITTAELAETLDMSEKNLCRIEEGRYSIRIDALEAILNALDATISIQSL